MGRLSGGKFDLVGAVTSTAVLVVFLLAMSNGAELGWRSAPIAAGFAAVIGLAAFFTYWEMRARNPMLDVTLFRHPVFTIGVAASAISFMSIASVRFLMPFYLQTVLGFSPGAVGLVLAPAAFSMIVVGPLGGRLSDRYGWTPFNAGGLLFSAIGLFVLSRATETSPISLIVLGTVTQSVGMGTFNPPNNSSILSVVDRSSYGAMSGFLNLVRNAANITGIAVATTIVVTVMGAQGFEPSLAAVSESGAQGVLGAFIVRHEDGLPLHGGPGLRRSPAVDAQGQADRRTVAFSAAWVDGGAMQVEPRPGTAGRLWSASSATPWSRLSRWRPGVEIEKAPAFGPEPSIRCWWRGEELHPPLPVCPDWSGPPMYAS